MLRLRSPSADGDYLYVVPNAAQASGLSFCSPMSSGFEFHDGATRTEPCDQRVRSRRPGIEYPARFWRTLKILGARARLTRRIDLRQC